MSDNIKVDKLIYLRPEDWDDNRIDALKDKDAADFIRAVVKSPFYDGYLAVLTTITNLNSELQDGVAKIVSEVTINEDGRAEVSDKAFERSNKFITEMQVYYEQLDYFRKHLTPQEIDEVNVKAADLIDEARLALKKKNGKV